MRRLSLSFMLIAVFLLCLPAVAGAQEEEKQTKFVYATYFECDAASGAGYSTIRRRASTRSSTRRTPFLPGSRNPALEPARSLAKSATPTRITSGRSRQAPRAPVSSPKTGERLACPSTSTAT